MKRNSQSEAQCTFCMCIAMMTAGCPAHQQCRSLWMCRSGWSSCKPPSPCAILCLDHTPVSQPKGRCPPCRQWRRVALLCGAARAWGAGVRPHSTPNMTRKATVSCGLLRAWHLAAPSMRAGAHESSPRKLRPEGLPHGDMYRPALVCHPATSSGPGRLPRLRDELGGVAAALDRHAQLAPQVVCLVLWASRGRLPQLAEVG